MFLTQAAVFNAYFTFLVTVGVLMSCPRTAWFATGAGNGTPNPSFIGQLPYSLGKAALGAWCHLNFYFSLFCKCDDKESMAHSLRIWTVNTDAISNVFTRHHQQCGLEYKTHGYSSTRADLGPFNYILICRSHPRFCLLWPTSLLSWGLCGCHGVTIHHVLWFLIVTHCLMLAEDITRLHKYNFVPFWDPFSGKSFQ